MWVKRQSCRAACGAPLRDLLLLGAQLVSAAPFVQDQPRQVRVSFELLAQVADVDPQAVLGGEALQTSDGAHQLLVWHHLVQVAYEPVEQIVRAPV